MFPTFLSSVSAVLLVSISCCFLSPSEEASLTSFSSSMKAFRHLLIFNSWVAGNLMVSLKIRWCRLPLGGWLDKSSILSVVNQRCWHMSKFSAATLKSLCIGKFDCQGIECQMWVLAKYTLKTDSKVEGLCYAALLLLLVWPCCFVRTSVLPPSCC